VRMVWCIRWLLISVAAAVWSAAAWGQPPGGLRGGLGFDQVLQRHDKNGDGKVTREEWRGPEELFGRMDTNNDAVITREEFQARMRARGGFGGPGSLSKEEIGRAPASPAGSGRKEIDGPSVVEGRKAGIEVGQYAPDFELQPIEPYAKLRQWLGDGAPESIEEKVRLSQLVGKQPILLLYGSYT
jgi:hypothetical protein